MAAHSSGIVPAGDHVPVDHALHQPDPGLVSTLAIFAPLTAAERMPAQQEPWPRLTGDWHVPPWPVAALLIGLPQAGPSAAAQPVPVPRTVKP